MLSWLVVRVLLVYIPSLLERFLPKECNLLTDLHSLAGAHLPTIGYYSFDKEDVHVHVPCDQDGQTSSFVATLL